MPAIKRKRVFPMKKQMQLENLKLALNGEPISPKEKMNKQIAEDFGLSTVTF